MTRRMIDNNMWQNSNFAQMPLEARLLQIGLINHADDQGRIKADLMQLKIQIFPCDSFSLQQIQGWLDLMADNETIILYTVNGKQYAQLVNWWKYQSLQYAQPSQYPRPEGWKDRIRKTLTKGFIATCNWYTTDGTLLHDTCDMDGNPIAKSTSKPAGNQPPSTPNTPVEQPADSPVDSPEHSGDVQYNLTKEEINISERDNTNAARARKGSPPPPALPRKPVPLNGHTSEKVNNPKPTTELPYADPRKFVNGYIPGGKGNTPVEVYYERFHVNDRLTKPNEEDLMAAISDLDKWRSVVIAWQQAGYNPKNIGGQLDWYRDGIPKHVNGNGKNQPAQTKQEPAYKRMKQL